MRSAAVPGVPAPAAAAGAAAAPRVLSHTFGLRQIDRAAVEQARARSNRGRGGGGKRGAAAAASGARARVLLPDYDEERRLFNAPATAHTDPSSRESARKQPNKQTVALRRFLLEFQQGGAYTYFQQLDKIFNGETRVLQLEEDDLVRYFRGTAHDKLLENFEHNTLRYCALLAEAVQDILLERPSADFPREAEADFMEEEDIAAVISRHRTEQQQQQQQQPPPQQQQQQQKQQASAGTEEVPRILKRFYPEVHVVASRARKAVGLRSVRSRQIGRLVVVRGVVTRASAVKPLACAVAYVCDQCKHEVYQVVRGTQFMPLERCTHPDCASRAAPGMLFMETRGSKFRRFQEIRIQEPTDQVPHGHIPRCANVRLEGALTRRCAPGDVVTVTGVLLPTQHAAGSAQATAYTLVTDTHIAALGLTVCGKDGSGGDGADDSRDAAAERERAAMAERVRAVVEGLSAEERPQFLGRLARSIAPEIYGMEDVKRALLLQMVGAPTRVQSADGMKTRGDINVLLLGDPGVAKSQLLKHVAQLAPRGVYTSGKGSSGVGLMAAVVRDQTTGEFVLEGGSLVLADMGICCIDEFDKMDDADKTAIHEVMEQQTISIAKAGITTTLNARAAILAAANPVVAGGRYVLSRSPSENIGMPAALVSRFDLLFILLDTPDPAADRAKADHIISVHVASSSSTTSTEAAAGDDEPPQVAAAAAAAINDQDGVGGSEDGITLPGTDGLFTSAFLRSYIHEAKKCDPVVERDVVDMLVNIYVNLRKEEKQSPTEVHTYTSARSLLALIRLSQAMARLRFGTSVAPGDVEEALRLVVASKAAIVRRPRAQQGQQAAPSAPADPKSAVFGIIRDSARSSSDGSSVAYADVLRQVLVRGFTEDVLRDTLADYEQLGILALAADASTIRFLSWD